MLAEYAVNGAAANPQKEYGYRNGALLVTVSGGSAYDVGLQGAKCWTATPPSLGHATSQQEGGNWAAYAGTHSSSHMVYGPYDNTFGQGPHVAQFTLMVENNSGSDVVATLDVVTGYGANVLASRQIRRNEFVAANQWQTFSVPFDNPCFGLVEARVWWTGNTNTKFSQLLLASVNSLPSDIRWLVTDQLGTPRMIFDQSGTLAKVKRHDYLPFGEELFAGTGGRSAAQGYATGDNVRQQFTAYERDNETGLDYAHARYYSSIAARFTTTDPLMASGQPTAPQTWNRYSYGLNNPLKYIDPSGLTVDDTTTANDQRRQQEEQQRQQQVKVPLSELGEPPPPLVSTVTFNVPEPREYINEPTSEGTFFTGVGSNIEITARDAAGNPITGISVTETVVAADGRTIRQRLEPLPVRSDGRFQDLVGVGLNPPPNTPITQERAEGVLNRIAQTPTNQNTIQTLRFYAPEGYMLGIAVVQRNFTNLDANGNVKPTSGSSGRPVDNYSTKVRLLTMLPPEK